MERRRPRKILSRREAILVASGRLAGAALIGSTGLQTLAAVNHETNREANQTPPAVISEQNQQTNHLREKALSARASLGLRGDSPEAVTAMEKQNSKWLLPRANVRNNLPHNMKSYGELTEYFFDEWVTNDIASRLLREMGVDISLPYGNRWHVDSRSLQFSRAITELWDSHDPNGWPIQGFNVHEGAHMVDVRWLAASCPEEVFWKAEAAKWAMLGQAPAVTGRITENNFNWRLESDLPTTVGEVVATEYRDKKSVSAKFSKGDEVFPQVLAQVAQERKRPIEDLRFNKFTSFLLGKKLLAEIRKGTMHFNDEMQTQYNDAMVDAFKEIFAEMMRGVFIRPDLINNNQIIIDEAQNYIHAMRGDSIPIERLKRKALAIPAEINWRWNVERQQENPARYGPLPSSPNGGPTREPSIAVPTAKETEDMWIGRMYAQFVRRGPSALPNDLSLAPEDMKLWRDHLEAIQITSGPHFVLSNLDPDIQRDRFDPNLDLKVIREIEAAYDPAFIQGFMRDHYVKGCAPVTEEERNKLRNKTEVLHGFIQSDAFGT